MTAEHLTLFRRGVTAGLPGIRRAPGAKKATRDRYAIRGYASTAARHGITVFTAIRDALAGNPWTSPIPASA